MRRRRHFRDVRYRGSSFVQTQSEAVAATREGHVGIVMAGPFPKMAVFLCPSGCGEILRVNLMREMGKAWKLRRHRNGRISLWPSIDLETGCRCHFYLVSNTARVLGG